MRKYYNKYFLANEFWVALVLLLFMIVYPDMNMSVKILFTWIIIFVIFRQITGDLNTSLFVSVGLVVLLLLYKYLNPGSMIMEGLENEKSVEVDVKDVLNIDSDVDGDKDGDKEDDGDSVNTDDESNYAKIVEDDSDDDDLVSDKSGKRYRHSETFEKTQKQLYHINKSVKELHKTMDNLVPSLKKGEGLLSMLQKFDFLDDGGSKLLDKLQG